ncbi:hypothetical protein Tco_0850236 [Tanacetum coccineum]
MIPKTERLQKYKKLDAVFYGLECGLEVGSIRRIQGIRYGVLEFLGVGTTHGYTVSSLMDTAYWFKGFDQRYELSIGGVSIRGSRGASPSEVHKERTHRRFTRSASIGGSRVAPPSEVHDGRLHQSLKSSTKVSPSEGFQPRASNQEFPSEGFQTECLHRRGSNRSVSIGGVLNGVSPSERGVPTGMSPSEGFQPRASNRKFPSKGFQPEYLHRRGSNRSVSVGGVPNGVSPSEVPTGVSPSEGLQPECLHWKGSNLEPPTELHLIPWRDDTDADSNATLEPMYVEGSKILPQKMFLLIEVASKVFPIHLPHSLENKFSYFMLNMLSFASSGVSEGKDATTNKLNEDADPNGRFPDDGFDDDDRDKIGKEILHFAPSPYYMRYPYDEGLSSNPSNLKKELFKDHKVFKTILDRTM